MIHKTLGIALSYFKYREHSIIARVYTRKFGLQSYLVRGANRRPSRTAFFQPLSLLDIVMRYKATRGLQYVSELCFWHMYRSIPFEVRKSPYVLFISGVLSQLIESHEEPQEADPRFDFLVRSLQSFDGIQGDYLRFCIQFLSKLTDHAGIGLGSMENIHRQLAVWDRRPPKHLGQVLYILYQADYDSSREVSVEASELKLLWCFLLHYYGVHLQEVQSFFSYYSSLAYMG